MRRNNNFKPKFQQYRTNHFIRANTVRLIDHEAKQIDVLPLSEALKLAQEQGLDLVEVAPQAQPPVVKLIDYNKFLYQLKKKKQEEKKGQKASETKEIRMKPFIGEHDLEIKIKHAKEFLEDGHKVRVVIRFQGRAITRQEIGKELSAKIVDTLKEDAKVDREPHMEGRQLVMLLSRLK